MIIIEDTPVSPTKLIQDRPPSEPRSQPSQNPPPGYSATDIQQPYPYPRNSPNPILPLDRRHDRRDLRITAKNRFFGALLAALAIYVILALFLHRVVIMVGFFWNPLDATVGYPQQSDGNIHHCVRGGDKSWTPISDSQYISFDLPLSADALYLFARGSQATGSLEIVPNDSSVADGMMHVDIYAHFSSVYVFRQTTVCKLERRPGEYGVGIFTPQRVFSHPTNFRILVRLPRSNSSRLSIRAFEADLPLFQISLPDLAPAVYFDSLYLHSTNIGIDVKSVDSEMAYIETSNAPITGTFRTSSSLSIRTSNSPIEIAVSMANDPKSKNTTVLDMRTSNAVLVSDIRLTTASELPHTPRYYVNAKTSNSPIKISFPQHQPYSRLDLTSTTSNGASWIWLNPAYEGTFDLSNSVYMNNEVQYEDHVTDPTGRGRMRNVAVSSIRRGRTTGWVHWGRGGDVEGSVVAKTSNAKNELLLL